MSVPVSVSDCACYLCVLKPFGSPLKLPSGTQPCAVCGALSRCRASPPVRTRPDASCGAVQWRSWTGQRIHHQLQSLHHDWHSVELHPCCASATLSDSHELRLLSSQTVTRVMSLSFWGSSLMPFVSGEFLQDLCN